MAVELHPTISKATAISPRGGKRNEKQGACDSLNSGDGRKLGQGVTSSWALPLVASTMLSLGLIPSQSCVFIG